MLQSWRKKVAVLAVAVCLLVAARPARAQFATVTLKSIDDVLSATGYILTEMGQGDQAKQLGVVNLFLKGIDTKKPLGVYVLNPKDATTAPATVFFVPVSKEDDLIELLKQVNVTVSEPKDGVRTIEFNNQAGHLRFANGHAYVAQEADHLKGNIPDPAKFLTGDNKSRLIAASLRFGQLSKTVRQEFIDQVAKQSAEQKKKKDTESEPEYRGRLFGMKLAQDTLVRVVQEGEDLSLSAQVDTRTGKISLDVSLSASPGSKLAGQFKQFAKQRSQFSALARDSVLNVLARLPISEELLADVGKLFDEIVKEALAKEVSPEQKKLTERMFRLMRSSFGSGTIDLGFAMFGPYPDKKAVFVSCMHVNDGKKVEEQIRALIAQSPKDDSADFKLDHARIGKHSVHRATSKAKMDEKATKVFGKADIYWVFREDSILATFGEHGLEAMKEVLQRLERAGEIGSAPVQLEIGLLKATELFGQDSPKEIEAIHKALADAPKGTDRIRIVLLGGDTLRLRLEADVQLLKAGAAASKAKSE